MKLTEEQQKAVTMEGRNLVVIAGPGSGKTETLAERIRQDQDRGIEASKQVAITFTNNAGDELRQRLMRKMADAPMHVGTVHSWAFRTIKGLGKNRPHYADMEVLNDKQYEATIKEVIGTLGHRTSVAKARELAMTSGGTAGNAMVLALAIRRTMLARKKLHADLMLAFFAAELENDRAVEEGLAIYVDEYQDTAKIDSDIYRLLRKRHGASFYVVGDFRQAIYGFRGATPVHFAEAVREADDTAMLTTNWRSRQSICETANRMAKKMATLGVEAIPITAATEKQGQVGMRVFDTAEEEALAMGDWIRTTRPGKSLAILTRYNQGVRLIAGILRAHGFDVQASTDAEQLEEGTRELPVERLIYSPNRDKHGWKQELASVGAPLAVQEALAGRLARATTSEARLAILSGTERPPERDKIWVSTIHAAKGLEWDGVWLAGMDNQAFREDQQPDHCLAFVGVTRARSRLMMTYARSRQAHKRETGLKETEIEIWPV